MKSKKRLANWSEESMCGDISELPGGNDRGFDDLNSNNREVSDLPRGYERLSLIGQTIMAECKISSDFFRLSDKSIDAGIAAQEAENQKNAAPDSNSISNDSGSDNLSSNNEEVPDLPRGYEHLSLIGQTIMAEYKTSRLSDKNIDAGIAAQEAENQKNAASVNDDPDSSSISNDRGSGNLSLNNEEVSDLHHNCCVEPSLIGQIFAVVQIPLESMRRTSDEMIAWLKAGIAAQEAEKQKNVITVNADPDSNSISNDRGSDNLSSNNEKVPCWFHDCVKPSFIGQAFTVVQIPPESMRLSDEVIARIDAGIAAREVKNQKNTITVNADPDSNSISNGSSSDHLSSNDEKVPYWFRDGINPSFIGIQTLTAERVTSPDEKIARIDAVIAAKEGEKQKNAITVNADPDSVSIVDSWDWSQGYSGTFDWKVAAIGDFQGDGIDDIIVWQKSTGNMYAWEDGDSSNRRWVGNLSASNWEVAAVGDYNGDGKDDLLLRELIGGGLGYWGGANASNWTDLNTRIKDESAIIA